jgi:hypothetical protein
MHESSRGLLTRELAHQALDHCAALLESMSAKTQINGSRVIHVVVIDPASAPDCPGRILIERSFGLAPGQWDANYAAFARAKAQLSWRCACDSHVLFARAPQQLREGDSTLWGSVYLDGLAVGVSGCEPAWDEALAGVVAMMLRATAKCALTEAGRFTIGDQRSRDRGGLSPAATLQS